MTPQTIVIKLGTSVLTQGSKHLNRAHMIEIVRQCANLKLQGHKIIIVTSGAIAAGRECLSYPNLPKNMASKQMLAAVGQSKLMQIWAQLFEIYQIKIGQMLLTRADLEDRERYLNARDMLGALLDNNIIPIVNENDAVATTEIKVGDNDNLSALVAILANANKLVLLTDQKGLFTNDPRKDPNATLIKTVKIIDDKLKQLAGQSGTNLGTGGMITKLQAANIAMHAGIEVIIATGAKPEIITNLDNAIGTRFLPIKGCVEGRKQWILAGPATCGSIYIDNGASKAITEQGCSLLPKGITKVNNNFMRGDVVHVCTTNGKIIAKGICHYSSCDLEKIKGMHSDKITPILGYEYGAVAIHRDDLVIL